MNTGIKKQRVVLGISAGMALFTAFLYLYPIRTTAPAGDNNHGVVSAEEEKPQLADVAFTVLASGETAPGAKSRKNYAIYTQTELDDFWKIAHGADGKKAPKIDFKQNYVIVVFAGTKPTTGYSIAVIKVSDIGDARNIDVSITEPGEGCTTKDQKTSPYQFVQVPFGSESSLSHSDVTTKKSC